MNNNILIDNINIKTLPELIIAYLKKYNINSNLNSVRNFYNLILSDISVDIRDSYLNKIQKYLSYNEACQILIFDDINDRIYDNQLKDSCKKIIEEIEKADHSTELYNSLLSKCYFIHFDDDELNNINNAFNNKDYNNLMFYLFKHAIKNYKISTPKILTKRIYDDAMTLSKDITIRKKLFKISADLGNSDACLQYAISIYNEDRSERFFYLLKSKDLDVSLWMLSYIIEKFAITKQQLEQAKIELKDIINFSNDYDDCKNIKAYKTRNNFEMDCLITAFKIDFYLAHKKNFSKGYNSIGKLLINNVITYTDKNNKADLNKTNLKGVDYLKRSVALSNLHAMDNLAIYYKKNNINSDYIKPLLLIGAENEDLISCVELSKVLMEENKLDEAINYLKYASKQKSAYAQHNLAKTYERKFDFDNARYWYQEAIKNGSKHSVINLAKLYFKEYIGNEEYKKKSYLIYAIDLLNDYLDIFDEEDKKTAKDLIKKYSDINN